MWVFFRCQTPHPQRASDLQTHLAAGLQALLALGYSYPLFIESQVCNKCFKYFSPEIVLSKHLSICSGPGFEDLEEEMDFYRNFFVDEEYDNNNEYYGDY